MNQEEINSILSGDSVELLGGLGTPDAEVLLGAILRLPQAQRATAIKKVLNNGQQTKAIQRQNAGGANLSFRDEALIRSGSLPKHLLEQLASRRMQMSDHILYWVKAANTVAAGATTRMITNADVKAIGVTNVQAGQLEENQHFLLCAIRFTTGLNASPLAASYGVAEAAARNGDFEAKVNGKYILPKDTAASVFDTTNQSNVIAGTYRLSNPKWLTPKTDLIFDIRNAAATAATTNFKLEYIGISVQPF